jgi:hypothetical protein
VFVLSFRRIGPERDRAGALRRLTRGSVIALLLAVLWTVTTPALAQRADQPWKFAVSGDSRNCGDVVMPAIAATAIANQAAFYWHLGDLRYAQDFDEDMQHLPAYKSQPMSIVQYMAAAWPDFIEHQIKPFGAMPYFVGIGNHETVYPRTRLDFIQQFGDWLVTPQLLAQRLKDDPSDHMVRTYFHWIQGGIAFYNLDNATADMFDSRQLRWFDRLLKIDAADPSISAIVVGLHAALPDSVASDHSMSDYPEGVESGRLVYQALLQARNQGKKVYILASHLHAYIANVYDTPYWREHGGVLPGWIVGTAGAFRMKLPSGAAHAVEAKVNTYGSLIANVQSGGTIEFVFKEVNEPDVPAAVVARYGPEFVRFCFAENREK